MSRRDNWERALLELVPDKGVRDALDAQYMALEAENLSLRERVGFMGLGTHAELVRVRYEMKEMREENERLRELAVHLWRHSDFCKDCALAEGCEMTADLPRECPMRQAHRDLQVLGIEV